MRKGDTMFISRKIFSSGKTIIAEKIKDYEYGISRWFDAAEELYPDYYDMSLSQQYVLKASIDNYVGYSI